jgi:hypothetical protein
MGSECGCEKESEKENEWRNVVWIIFSECVYLIDEYG